MNVEIRQVQDPIQANARGAAWIAAVGLGEIAFGDVPGLVEFRRTYTPASENRAAYDERFVVFTQIYKQMKGVYNRLNG
jgi:xylulokinase